MRSVGRKRGFTLIEMIAALAIIGIVGLTVMLTVSSSVYIANKNKQKEAAITVKTDIADSIKASQSIWKTKAGFETWLISNGYTHYYYYYYSNKYFINVTENGVTYNVILQIDSTGVDKLFEVTITVNSHLVKDSVLVTRYYG